MAKQIQDNTKFTGIRLPKTVRPIHYDINLKPNLSDFTFSGAVKIHYESVEATKNIVLHAQDVVITDGMIQNDSTVSPLNAVYYSKDTETATLEFHDTIASSGDLQLNFTGILNDKMKGFYRTAFKIGETTVNAATTQFEATDARRCFPCWDEPNIKATFSVSLVIPKTIKANDRDYECLALSNMNEISRSETPDGLKVDFGKTPIMSTYLLAFIVGPFESIEGGDMKRPIRVFTTPGKTEQGRFALDVACKSLPFYEHYFGIDYPLPKMDLIAIPDFASGAMENWGLVTYRETCLLVDPVNTSTQVKQYVAIVVAHELAHQWFGNFVTMEWWTHLWLNEGFASFMEYLCVDHMFPEYEIWTQFVTDSYGRALDLDCLHNSHPIEVPVNHPSEIDEIFDDISYNKGAAVIRMLYNYIGDDCFRKGMKSYLTKFAYKNATTEDLWDYLESASNKPVRKLMSGWTAQKGYPWLSVEYAADGDNAKLTVTQNKFTSDGQVPAEETGFSWMVPISGVYGDNPSQIKELCLLQDKTAEIELTNIKDTWVKLNPGSIGLYRVAYPEALMKKLEPAILDQTLEPMDRLGIQSDYFALCGAGKIDTVQLLKLLKSFQGETDYTVWKSIDSCISRLYTLSIGGNFKELLEKFGRELYGDIFKKMGWSVKPNEKHVDALFRGLIINRLVSLNDAEVIEEAKKRFAAHMNKTENIPADLRGAIYKAVSIHGNDETFESLFEIYRSAELQEEKVRAARALGFSNPGDRLNKVLEFILSDEVRIQDKPSVLIVVGVANPAIGWKFFQDNKEFIRDKYGRGHMLGMMVKYITQNFTSEDRANEVAQFFEANKFPVAERSVQQSIEAIRLNANWLARDSEKIKAFLQQN